MPRPKSGTFVAKIGHKGKSIYIGSFQSNFAAACAYDVVALNLKGRSAVLNFPSAYGTAVAALDSYPRREEASVKTFMWL